MVTYFSYRDIVDNKIVINNVLNSNEKYIVIEINCTETLLNDHVFKINCIS